MIIESKHVYFRGMFSNHLSQHTSNLILIYYTTRSCADQILLLLESPTSYNSFHAQVNDASGLLIFKYYVHYVHLFLQLHINCYIFLSVAHEMICTEV